MKKCKCARCGKSIPNGEVFYIKVGFTQRYAICPDCQEDWDNYLWKLSEQFVRAGVFIKEQEV